MKFKVNKQLNIKFASCITILVLMLVSVKVFSQSDTTITYNGVTKTFNFEEVRSDLLKNTDLSTEEVEATLGYEPFWHSLFPPSNQSGNIITPSSPANNNLINCLGFDNLQYDPNSYEITDGSPWEPYFGCVSGTTYPIAFNSINWASNNSCGNTSNDPFTIVNSNPNSYDTYVKKNGQPIIQLVAPSGKSQFIKIGDFSGGYHAHRIVGSFTVSAQKPILTYNFAVAMQDVGSGHDGSVLGDTGKPYFTMQLRAGEQEIPCTAYSIVGVASTNSELETEGITVGSTGGFLINWKANAIDLSNYIGQDIEIEISVVECNLGGHGGWAYIDMSCEESSLSVTNVSSCFEYEVSSLYQGNYVDEEYLWNFGDGTTSTLPTLTHTYSAPGTYTITLDISYTNFPNGNDTSTQENCSLQVSKEIVVDPNCCDSCSPPVLQEPPPTITVDCSADVPGATNLIWTSDCDEDNGFVPSVDISDENSCPEQIARTWTYIDFCGNVATRTQLIIIDDTTLPQLSTLPADATIQCIDDIPAMPTLTWTDNCDGSGTVTGTQTSNNNECPTSITRQWSYTDNCGNTTTRTQIITIDDTIFPQLTAPPNATFQCTDDIPAMPTLTWTDNCDGSGTVTGTETIQGDGCPLVVTRNWTYTDACGNTTDATQTITIDDTTSPQLDAPPSATYDCLSEVPPMENITWTDNCNGTGTVVGTETNDGNECPLTITRTWEFTDGCNNTVAHDQVITVRFTQYQCDNGVFQDSTCIEEPPPPCTECPSSFSPKPGYKYVLSAWVKESNSPGALTYENANITLSFEGSSTVLGPFLAKGTIIDGWQRIEEEFMIPSDAIKIKVSLNNSDSTKDAFFDDVRFFPFNATMKSFVYDPVTLRLSAELDERNYATFYEYDEEGALIRIKKETARGVMTIQEARNASRKVSQ